MQAFLVVPGYPFGGRDLPLQAFNHVVWQSNSDLSELVHHSDRGSQYLSLVYTDRLGELGISPSVGSRGQSYDNALAEAVNAAYKTELINRGKPWRYIDDVERSSVRIVAATAQPTIFLVAASVTNAV